MALRQIIVSLQRLSVQAPSIQSKLMASPSLHLLKTSTSSQMTRCSVHNIPKPINTENMLESVTRKENERLNLNRKSIYKTHEYTIKPIPRTKTGGRDENGRVCQRSDAGGHKRHYRMIANNRRQMDGSLEPFQEKVMKIMYDPNRSARIALTAYGDQKRYIIATENMKAGDLLNISSQYPPKTVTPREGDCFPVGSLSIGTIVSNIERYPNAGASVAKSAGTTGIVVRKIDDRVIIQMPSKREMNISKDCLATIGRVSNIDHDKRVIGKAGRNRWLSIRPRSGLWHRKDGRYGRKIKPMKSAKIYTEKKEKIPTIPLTLT